MNAQQIGQEVDKINSSLQWVARMPWGDMASQARNAGSGNIPSDLATKLDYLESVIATPEEKLAPITRLSKDEYAQVLWQEIQQHRAFEEVL